MTVPVQLYRFLCMTYIEICKSMSYICMGIGRVVFSPTPPTRSLSWPPRSHARTLTLLHTCCVPVWGARGAPLGEQERCLRWRPTERDKTPEITIRAAVPRIQNDQNDCSMHESSQNAIQACRMMSSCMHRVNSRVTR